MNRFVNIGILLLLVLFISFRVNVACNELRSEKTQQEIFPFEIPVTFSGILSCSNCVDIVYTLTLENDRFYEKNNYLDDETDPVEMDGRWDFRSDTLYLYNEEIVQYKSFSWEEDKLIFLDINDSGKEGHISNDIE